MDLNLAPTGGEVALKALDPQHTGEPSGRSAHVCNAPEAIATASVCGLNLTYGGLLQSIRVTIATPSATTTANVIPNMNMSSLGILVKSQLGSNDDNCV